ncbi:Gfo/Idh/MocA family oxidoreductase [Streptomyces sp. NPDC050211]|uniref:Gfo/Idh/MocA family oxidoreductase n=1 Tax=Streptomyces sp. NPDC050211 TaxID=3154932 RepID=UPI003414C7DC
MTADDRTRTMRVVVCGTNFGRIYLSALARTTRPFQLAGILARGSERSKACAERYGVPLYTSVDRLPEDIDAACVVVNSGINGGAGGRLAVELMDRGLHVLQEHPVHEAELADCLRAARRAGVVYRLNTLYPHVAPVRRFLAAGRALLAEQRPLFVDATYAVQVAYPLFDILERLLGGVRPWQFDQPVATGGPFDPAVKAPPFRSLDGVLAGVPLSLRVQHQMDPVEPDNHIHLLHRISLGTEGGVLTLAHTHGPVLFSPRLHRPPSAADVPDLAEAAGSALDLPSATVLGPATAPTHRQVLARLWPDAVERALVELRTAVLAGTDPLRDGRRHLAAGRVWAKANALLGAPDLMSHRPPVPVDPTLLTAAVAALDDER